MGGGSHSTTLGGPSHSTTLCEWLPLDPFRCMIQCDCWWIDCRPPSHDQDADSSSKACSLPQLELLQILTLMLRTLNNLASIDLKGLQVKTAARTLTQVVLTVG